MPRNFVPVGFFIIPIKMQITYNIKFNKEIRIGNMKAM